MVTVIKQNHLGEKLLEYSGEVLTQGKTWVCIEAIYNNPDKDAGYVVFRRGDIRIRNIRRRAGPPKALSRKSRLAVCYRK